MSEKHIVLKEDPTVATKHEESRKIHEDNIEIKDTPTEPQQSYAQDILNEAKVQLKRTAAETKTNLNKIAVEVTELIGNTAHDISDNMNNVKKDIEQKGIF